MINSGMMVCSFYLKTRFARRSHISWLNDKFSIPESEDSYDNILEALTCFCRECSEFQDDEGKMKLFSIDNETVKSHEDEDYNALSFTINSGAYGVESSITNRETKKVRYRKTANDADVKNFKCVVLVPKDTDEVRVEKGIIVFQTIASYGVKTITVDKMREFFSQMNLTLETRSVSVKAFIEKLVAHGDLYKLTLIRNKVSPDSSDNIFINTGKEIRSYIRPKLKQEWVNKFLSLVDHRPATDVFEIDEEEYNDIKVTFRLRENYRTVALRYIDRYSVVEDIPKEIYNNGRFKDVVLTDYMIQTANDYKEKMVFNVG